MAPSKGDTPGIDDLEAARIVQIAREIMEKKRKLDVSELYSTVKRELKLPRDVILHQIQRLLRERVLVEGSKYTRETVAQHPYRARILDLVRSSGAITYSSLKRMILTPDGGRDVSAGQLIWHIGMLLKFQWIKKVRVQRFSVFVPYEMDEDEALLKFVCKDKTNEKIIDLIHGKVQVKRPNVYKEILEVRELVYYRIAILVDLQILVEDDATERALSLAPRFFQYLETPKKPKR